MKRKQFTFYYSFYDVIQCIEDKQQRADAYDAVCAYALLGEKPDMETLSTGARMVMKMCKPILAAANKKAAAGKKHGRCEEDTGKIGESCEEELCNKNKDKIKDKDKDKDNSLTGARERFECFWKEYPKKVDKKSAWAVFQGVEEDVQVLLDALRQQKRSAQWLDEDGRFIPRAAAWLRQRRWEDELPRSKRVPMGASGELGQAELDAIRRMMAE